MADVWFTSDFHLGHFNIIRYCNRPFADAQEMNAAILERLNASRPENRARDFCMGRPKAVASFREQIACRTVHFIEGSHDKTTRKAQHLFTSWSSLILCQGDENFDDLSRLDCTIFDSAGAKPPPSPRTFEPERHYVENESLSAVISQAHHTCYSFRAPNLGAGAGSDCQRGSRIGGHV